MKKTIAFLSLLISLFLLVSCNSKKEPDSKYIKYEMADDGSVVITSVATGYTDLILPSEIDGKKVSAIKDSAFYRDSSLRSVFIPSGVRTIGKDAFADCPYLNSVIFEKGGNTRIGDAAFENCFRLKTVKFNGSVTQIEDKAFKNCKRIGFLKIGSEVIRIGTDAFMGCEQMIFKAEEGSYGAIYAQDNYLTVRFTDSLYFLWMILAILIICTVVFLILLSRFQKKKRMQKAKSNL